MAKKRQFIILLALVFAATEGSAQEAYIPNCSGTYPKNVFVMFSKPGGGGTHLESCYSSNYSGSTVDATITVTIRDADNNVIVGHPADRTQLKVALSPSCLNCAPFHMCTQPAIADGPTNGHGVTRSRSNLSTVATFSVVNLSDIGPYATLHSSGYSGRAGFNTDGILNIADTSILAGSLSSACPRVQSTVNEAERRGTACARQLRIECSRQLPPLIQPGRRPRQLLCLSATAATSAWRGPYLEVCHAPEEAHDHRHNRHSDPDPTREV